MFDFSMMATARVDTDDKQNCPICFGHFNLPRQLPCAHTFCQRCLQSCITTEATKHKKLDCIECPVCRKIARPPQRDKPTSEWASLFPANTVFQSIISTKCKVDSLCDRCNPEGISVPAERLCAVCQEAMCGHCIKCHSKQTISKNHTIVKIEEFTGSMENVMKCVEGFTCSDHEGVDLKFYCRNHRLAICAICYLHSHQTCCNVIVLKKELHALMSEIKPEDIIAELTNIEISLQKFMEINESSVNVLESQVNGLTDQIRDMRKKINAVLDDLEEKVKTEGSRIYKEVATRKQKENHQCLALVHAVRNSHFLFETVHTYGSEIQKFLITEKIKSQLPPYYNQIRENYEMIDTVTVELEFTPLVKSILSLSSSDVGKILPTTGSKSLSLRKPAKDCWVEKAEVIHVEVPGIKEPCYTGITFLPGGKVMLADWENKQCILLSPLYRFLASYKVSQQPVSICVVDDQKVALTLHRFLEIQILSVIDDISLVRTIETKYTSCVIASAGEGEMVLTGDCGNDKHCWSLMSTGGEIKSSHQYDAPSGYWNYIALDSAKTRVYITVAGWNSLLCFNMDGQKLLTYSPDNLKWPLGISMDRDDNIYIIGHYSHNIHQLSTDGSVMRVITDGVPNNPRTICFDKIRDVFIVLYTSDRRKLFVYQLK